MRNLNWVKITMIDAFQLTLDAEMLSITMLVKGVFNRIPFSKNFRFRNFTRNDFFKSFSKEIFKVA